MEVVPIPEFVNRELLERAIKSYEKDETIELENFTIAAAFAEHFGSEMFRVKLFYKSAKFRTGAAKTLAVVIKVKPLSDSRSEQVVAGGPLFETEIEMYEKVLPAFHELYARNGQTVDFAPELIYTTDRPSLIIILRDLTPDAYAVFRDPPHNADDINLFTQKLAQFHAASIYLQENNQLDLSSFNYTIYQNESILDLFFRDAIRAFREVVETWGEEYEIYLPKLDNLIKNIGEIGKKCYTANKNGCGFNVLNHGDLHLRNILIKANAERRIEHFYFIDFQINVWCSPAIDLAYLMGLYRFDESPSENKNDVIIFYHRELVKALKSIGYIKAPPSLLDINVELLKHGSMNVAFWIVFYPYRFIDWSTMSVEDIMGNDSERSRNFKKKMYEFPALKRGIQSEMKKWMYKGWW